MTRYLDQPFPLLHQRKYVALWVLELLLLVTLFEYILEPFKRNYSEHLYDYWIICVFHAAEVTCSYLIAFSINEFIHKRSSWTLRDELRFLCIMLCIVGIGNFLIRDLIYDADNWYWSLLWEEMYHGWIAGGIFYFVFFNLNIRLISTLFKAENEEGEKQIQIEASVAADSFKVQAHEILCIKADGNYAVFYIRDTDGYTEKMIRQTLDNVEQQLAGFPSFLRTHRAFIVNTDHITSHSGNTAGYQLTIASLPFSVPVSRSKTAHFTAVLDNR